MRKINKSAEISRLIRVTAALTAVLLIVSIGYLFARYFLDGGHDVSASHDTFDVRIVANNSAAGEAYEINNGVITIENSNGFRSGEPLPLTVDIYYKGESYAYIRLMLLERWQGRYASTMNGEANQVGILPEPLMVLNLNSDVPMSDNRRSDGYIYLTQIQTTLTEAETDTVWVNQSELLRTRTENEIMYREENGKFVESSDGEWRKLSILKEGAVILPQFTDETDSVNQATVTTLNLYLQADAVQFNRFETFWNISEIPTQTNLTEDDNK